MTADSWNKLCTCCLSKPRWLLSYLESSKHHRNARSHVSTHKTLLYFLIMYIDYRPTVRAISRLQSVVKVFALNDLNSLYLTRSLKKAQAVLADLGHHLNSEFELLPSGRRYSLPSCGTNRHKRSFVGLLNSSTWVVHTIVMWYVFIVHLLIACYLCCYSCCTTNCPSVIINTNLNFEPISLCMAKGGH